MMNFAKILSGAAGLSMVAGLVAPSKVVGVALGTAVGTTLGVALGCAVVLGAGVALGGPGPDPETGQRSNRRTCRSRR